MTDFSTLTDDAMLADLGARLAEYRLRGNLTQQELAREAGVHKNTIVRLEGGGSTQFKNVIRVLRVLGLVERLNHLIPSPEQDPLHQLESQRRARKRARSKRREPNSDSGAWTWNDRPNEESS